MHARGKLVPAWRERAMKP
eukprot:Gb_29674 [translate_table: standard]